MTIRMEKVWKVYVASLENFALLLDGFACHEQESCLSVVQELGTHVEHISGRYICVLQPYVVGVRCSSKVYLQKSYLKQTGEKYADVNDQLKVPASDSKDISE